MILSKLEVGGSLLGVSNVLSVKEGREYLNFSPLTLLLITKPSLTGAGRLLGCCEGNVIKTAVITTF